MTEPHVEFVGGSEAMADMRKWASELGPQVSKASEPFAHRVAGIIAGRVPHLSGQLAGSVEASSDDEGVEVGYDGSVAYDGWIEFGGTRGRSYVPDGRYVWPSALEAQDEYEQVAAEAADDSARRFAWSTPSA